MDEALERVEAWFASRGWKPFPFQREVWRAYLAGESGLVHAATGTGKTLAAWIGPLLEASRPSDSPLATRHSSRHSLRVVWITPLRALAADTAESLHEPLEALGIGWRVETRTGDTSPAQRARQQRRLPEALVTTPESLTLFLTREDVADVFGDLRLVVVDEWHELMGTKRGVQVELALARLRALRPGVRTWGLSATIGNLDVALRALLGVGAPNDRGRIIRGVEPKEIVVDALIPPVIERFVGGPPRHADAAAAGRSDRGGTERDRLHEHAVADGDLVSGPPGRTARLGGHDRVASWLAGSKEA